MNAEIYNKIARLFFVNIVFGIIFLLDSGLLDIIACHTQIVVCCVIIF